MIATTTGTIHLDGEPRDPHDPHLAGKVAYYPAKTDIAPFERALCAGDNAYATVAGHAAASFTYRAGSGKFRILAAEVWGISEESPDVCADKLQVLTDAVASEGWEWADTVGSLAGRICREYVELHQLAPRWRVLSHGAVHQGPMVCARGGAPYVVAWDREAAFLRALSVPVPVPGGWMAVHPRMIDAVAGMAGIVRATVTIDPEAFAGRLPPLPVRIAGATTYPVGLVRGVWTLDLLIDALRLYPESIRLTEVHELTVSPAAPLHAPAAERIQAIASKALRKLVYTRYWGRLATTGAWEGYTEPTAHPARRMLGSALYWYYVGREPMGRQCPPDYRPDHAAFIAADNHRAMNATIATMEPGTIVGAHVDCVWSADAYWTPADTSFRPKQHGYMRMYGIGTYEHGSMLAAMGLEGELTRESLATYGERMDKADGWYRRWVAPLAAELRAIGPAESIDARSNPPEHTEREAAASEPVNSPGDVYWQGWTRNGWIKEEPCAPT